MFESGTKVVDKQNVSSLNLTVYEVIQSTLSATLVKLPNGQQTNIPTNILMTLDEAILFIRAEYFKLSGTMQKLENYYKDLKKIKETNNIIPEIKGEITNDN